MTIITLPLFPNSKPATLSIQQKKRIAMDAFLNRKTQTQLAQEYSTNRKYIRQLRDRVISAIDNCFDGEDQQDPDAIFYLPVTLDWIKQLVLSLMLKAHASYRNIIAILNDLLDYAISLGTINGIFNDAVVKAKDKNRIEDLSKISVTANDELFHHGKPILTGIDTRSLYCYLLSFESHRDKVTWAINLLDAQDKGLNPERTIGDDGKGLVSGHKIVFQDCSYCYDNFHLSQEMMDLRRFFRNRLKTAIKAHLVE